MNPASLPPQITALQAQVVTLQTAFAQTQKELKETRLENKLLRQKLAALARRYFGKKSEQLSSAQLELLLSGLEKNRSGDAGVREARARGAASPA